MTEHIPFILDAIHLKDFALGAFAALALRRGRIKAILDQFIPGEEE